MKHPITIRAVLFLLAIAITSASAHAQAGTQPPPFTVPAPPMPNATQSPGQQPPPAQTNPQATPNAPLPQPDKSTIDLRNVAPLATEPPSPQQPSPQLQQISNDPTRPRREAPPPFATHLFNLIGAYHPVPVPAFAFGSANWINSLVRDGKLYLSLHDALALAIQNNLDVEVSRYNLLLADTDLTRAKGGGNLRGIGYTVLQPPPGVGEASTPLLITATTGSSSSTNDSIVDLSQVTQIGTDTPLNLDPDSTAYSPGPNVPLYDPVLTAQAGYLRRSDQTSLTTTTTSTSTSSTQNHALDFVNAGADYQQGFSTGAQIEAFADNASQTLYSSRQQYNPFHQPTTSVTLTQPLLRGRGRAVNLRFIRIARLNQKQSQLVFQQQLLETIYGISRLYYDLVTLGENIGVKEESLAAAQQLFNNDKDQVDQGTLAPIELTRAQALLSSSRLDLIQAQGEYRQQEVVLRQQILRNLAGPADDFLTIIPTDPIIVPDAPPTLDLPALISTALENRPDLAQASLQIKADEITVKASRNNIAPQLDLYASAQWHGFSVVPYQSIGSPGTGMAQPPALLTEGGLTLSTIYQGGLQLTLPLRNRIAQADAARDTIQLRQAQGRTASLENQVRQQVEAAAIAVDTAHQAYAAAVESSNYQQQLLQAEKDKLAVGAGTNYMVIQDEAYLAQARSTEVAARSDWMKAQLALHHALGDLLDQSNILYDEAVHGTTR